MKSKFTLVAGLLFSSLFTIGQEVPKKIVVEHFTNTLCGVCASRNPGFYTNYNSQNNNTMIHLAIHPSSPYSACIFNNHDKTANDDRTKYYNVFGATPRLVINGVPIPASSSFNSAALFAPFQSETTPISIRLNQQKIASDSVRVKVVLKTMAAHSLGTQNLFVVLAEDTIWYNAPNGEPEHFDVFRKSLFGTSGTSVTLPSTVGDSLVFIKTVAVHQDWDLSQIFALAILQNQSDKLVTQSEALTPADNDQLALTVPNVFSENKASIFPNPAKNQITIQLDNSVLTTFKVISIAGTEWFNGTFNNETKLDVSNLPNGVYFISLLSEKGSSLQKFVKTDF